MMKRGVLSAIAAVVLGAIGVEGAWQELAFVYEGEDWELVAARPLPEMRKKVRSPGAAGALTYLDYELEWQDAAGRRLLSVPIQLPLGVRVPIAETETSGDNMGGMMATRRPTWRPARFPIMW